MRVGDESTDAVDRQSWAALFIALGAMALIPFTVTGTNLAFPDIEAHFSGTARSTLSWILSGYSIVIAAFTMLGGQLSDRLDGERVFRWGLGLLALGSVVAGLAPSPGILIAGRALHGAGGALVVPSSLLIVTTRWPDWRHPFAIGVWTAAIPIGSVVAPGSGALIIQLAGWRWVYLTAAVICAVVAVAHAKVLHPVAAADPEDVEPSSGAGVRPDYLGVVIGTGGVGLATLGIVQGPNWGWLSPGVLVSVAVAVVAAPAFVYRSRRHPRPLVDLTIFSIPTFRVATMSSVFVSAVGASTWLLLPLLMSNEWDYSRLTVGLALTPAPAVVATCAIGSTRVAEVIGYRVTLLIGGAALGIAALWLLVRVGEDAQYLTVMLPGLVLHGVGMGFTFAPLNAAALSELPTRKYGQANATFATSRFLAAAVGIAGVVAALDSASVELDGYRRAFVVQILLALLATAIILLRWPGRALPQAPGAATVAGADG